MASGGVHAIKRKDRDGAMIVTLAYNTKLNGGEPERRYRPVAFDDKKNRHLLEPGDGGSSTTARFPEILIVMMEYRLDPNVLAFDRVKGLGFEVVSAEVLQAEADAARDQAFQEARALRIDLCAASPGRQALRIRADGCGRPASPLRRTEGQGRPDRLLGILERVMHGKAAQTQDTLRLAVAVTASR